MLSAPIRFDRYEIDPAERRLTRDGEAVELNARYFDALLLMARDAGSLITKERFMDEVWRGVPVTDEALTQCIRTLRRALGDHAAAPRFIETVPKHGYRFVAAVRGPADADAPSRTQTVPRPTPLLIGGAGTVGALAAGLFGGLIYGSAASAQPVEGGAGGLSALLVVTALTLVPALLGGSGVSFAVAAAARPNRARGWLIAAGAAGGFLVGGVIKLLGVDAFSLLLGRTPAAITGGYEGLLLGAAVGAAAWFAGIGKPDPRLRRGMIAGALAGGGAGVLIALTGGRLMAGSIDLLARAFPTSRLRVDGIGALIGEDGFGPIAQALTASLEGGLFAACAVGAMVLAQRRSERL